MFPLISIALFSLGGAVAYFFLSGFIWGAGYAPTASSEIDRVAGLLDLRKGDTFYDLGCGYGRMIFAMAERYDVKCIGIEIDPIKCRWIRFMAKRKKLQDRISVINSNLFEANLVDARKVFIFLSKGTDIMKKLQTKMFQEMQPQSRIVSYIHFFDDWTFEKRVGELYLYSVPERAELNER